ncbi:putative RNA methyltransferase [Tessaracoccus palaemonis]|uniref:Methyltransferase domain-containing protein n=1 Tax=Tessaracoccus palaemonis TaxID=2829499 RepID=A0ABX8SGG8_9ACTN|nr:methyltransferase domain-containing protein [Tessaracoccus palaemonis]QXT61954.1 methyltransferase domain-containing protein [Tessaracoccus palaemonis]
MSGLDWTRCPHCSLPLGRVEGSLRCAAGHGYDVARQGYVNLLGRAAPANADTPAMLEARASFLATGRYRPIADAIDSRVGDARRIVEVGAGTGWYLARALDASPAAEGLATDVSVAAAKRCARAHPRMDAVVADTWVGLPVQDGAVDLVLCVFAPRNAADFARILAPGGRLVVVVPRAGHLAELRERDGLLEVADDKADALVASLGDAGWAHLGGERVSGSMDLTAREAADLVGMGPNAFHEHGDAAAPITTTLDVDVLEFARP